MSQILLISDKITYCIFRDPVDMRMQFDGLCGVVKKRLQLHVKDEKTLFFFFNKRRSHMKALLCENDGMTMFYRRLHDTLFELPEFAANQKSINLDIILVASLVKGLTLHVKKDQ